MKKVVLELDKNLTENELLIYKNGKLISVEIHSLLPELKRLEELDTLRNDIAELQEKVKELRGED